MHRLSLKVVVVATLATQVQSGGIIRDLKDLEETYDYVIAGGGLSGLVVATRLSEDFDGKYEIRSGCRYPLTYWSYSQ